MIDVNPMPDGQLEDALARALLSLLDAARQASPELMERLSRRMITVGGAGYQEAMGAEKTAEAFYRMADNLAAEVIRK